VVDGERGERRRLIEEERRLPPGRRPHRVEPRVVADDAPVDPTDALLFQLGREARELQRGEGGVAETLEVHVAPPGRALLPARAEHLGTEAVSGPELDERRVGDRELLVRRGHQGQVCVALEQGVARDEVDRERAGRRG
jgi:hypothetical protein